GGPLASDADCKANGGQFCVRVADPGLVFTSGIDLSAGYWLTPRVAVSLGARVGLPGGEGPMSHLLVTGKVELLLTEPRATGLRIGVTGGVGVGQIQLRVPQGGSVVDATPDEDGQ